MIQRILSAIIVLALATAIFWMRADAKHSNANILTLHGVVDIRQVDLSFRLPGRIAEMRLEEGDAVVKGQTLAILDKTPLANQLDLAKAQAAQSAANLAKMQAGSRPGEIAQARALVEERRLTLTNAALVLERQQELIKKNSPPQLAVDNAIAAKGEAEARLSSAQKALDLALEGYRAEDVAIARAAFAIAEAQQKSAEIALSDTELLAPADGVIRARAVEPGAFAATGATVYTLSLKRQAGARAYISMPDLDRIHLGQAVDVLSGGPPSSPHKGRIGVISSVAEFAPKSAETSESRNNLIYRLSIVVDSSADNQSASLHQGAPVIIRIPLDQTSP
jgi:HlyD family secretion protein